AAGLRVRRGPGLVGPPPQAGPAGLAGGPAVAGARSRGQVLREQRPGLDPAGGAGGSGLRAARGRGLLRGLQELPGDGAVRDAVVRRVAPPHELGGAGPPVHHPGAARAGGKTPELTLDRTVRLLQRAIDVPGLSLGLALLLVEYHIHRNEVARRSHTK